MGLYMESNFQILPGVWVSLLSALCRGAHLVTTDLKTPLIRRSSRSTGPFKGFIWLMLVFIGSIVGGGLGSELLQLDDGDDGDDGDDDDDDDDDALHVGFRLC